MKMKKCPKCGMLTAESGECPICHATVTYEPIIYADKEKYAFNKYYVRYQLKNCLFSILLLLAVTVRVIIAPPFFIGGNCGICVGADIIPLLIFLSEAYKICAVHVFPGVFGMAHNKNAYIHRNSRLGAVVF